MTHPPDLQLSDRPSLAEHVVVRRLDGEIVACDGACETFVLLNREAVSILDLCDGKTCVGDIIERLQASYCATLEETRVGVLEALQQLRARGFLHLEESSG